MTTCLFYKDTAGFMDGKSSLAGDDVNQGLVARGAYTALSRAVEMTGHIHADIFSQDKLLLNRVPLRIKLIQSPDTFSLMAGGPAPAYKVQSFSQVVCEAGRCESVCFHGTSESSQPGSCQIPH